MVRTLSLVLLLVVLPASVRSAEKTDLSEFFAPGGLPGDYKVWRSDLGGLRTSELLDVFFSKKRVMYLSRRTEDGIVTLSESGLIPGKWLLDGSAMVEGLEIEVAKPMKTLPLKIVAGKPFRFRGGGRVYYFGERVGKAKLVGSITFVGFGPVVTPYWSVSDAASFIQSSTVTIKINGGGEIRVESGSSWSTDRELGSIEGVTETRSFEDGVFVEGEGPTTWWFDYGVLGGVAVP